MTTPTREPEAVFIGDTGYAKHDGDWYIYAPKSGPELMNQLSSAPLLEEIVRLRATLAAVAAERDALRVHEQLSDAIVDECDSDITQLVQERAALRQQIAAAQTVAVTERMRKAALDAASDGLDVSKPGWLAAAVCDRAVPAVLREVRAKLAPQREVEG